MTLYARTRVRICARMSPMMVLASPPSPLSPHPEKTASSYRFRGKSRQDRQEGQEH